MGNRSISGSTGFEHGRPTDDFHSKPIDAPKVTNKAFHVSDEICLGCSQNWEGECRAYEVPHSVAEATYRSSGATNCKQGRIFGAGHRAKVITGIS